MPTGVYVRTEAARKAWSEGQKRRYPPVEERFWAKVDKNGPTTNADIGPCWMWNASFSTNGYAQFWDGRRDIGVHRFSYELAKGPIPEGKDLHHVCHNRLCVNPNHLGIVTKKEHVHLDDTAGARNARKTHCPKGHPLEPGNLQLARYKLGKRICKICYNERHNEESHQRRINIKAGLIISNLKSDCEFDVWMAMPPKCGNKTIVSVEDIDLQGLGRKFTLCRKHADHVRWHKKVLRPQMITEEQADYVVKSLKDVLG